MKRIFDIVVSISLLVVLSPLLILLASLIRMKLGRPVLFRQTRPGKDTKPFDMVKFRTMTNERGADGKLLPDKVRLTPFGRFLRSTSLDELPELWNVLKGDMSLVGPRPLLMEYLGYYTEEEMLRFSVRPGITGLAQVNGRNETTWDARLAYDVQYVNDRRFLKDFDILLKTILQVARRSGVVVVPSTRYQKLNEERAP